MTGLTGRFARSLAGHDRGAWYIIISADDQSAMVTDGRLRPVSRPKRKNLKHLMITGTAAPADSLQRDEEIRKALRSFIKEDVNV